MKKIDTWEFEKDRTKIEVPVHLVKEDEYYKSQKVKQAFFVVQLPEHDIEARSENMTALKKKVFALLDAKINLDWKPFLHISLSGGAGKFPLGRKGRFNEGRSISLEVFSKPVLLATSATGEKLHKEHSDGVERHSRHHEIHVSSGWPEEGRVKKSYDDSATIYALVPDTPTNRAALNLLANDCNRLVDRLMQMFMPNEIERTLANANLKLLGTGNHE